MGRPANAFKRETMTPDRNRSARPFSSVFFVLVCSKNIEGKEEKGTQFWPIIDAWRIGEKLATSYGDGIE